MTLYRSLDAAALPQVTGRGLWVGGGVGGWGWGWGGGCRSAAQGAPYGWMQPLNHRRLPAPAPPPPPPQDVYKSVAQLRALACLLRLRCSPELELQGPHGRLVADRCGTVEEGAGAGRAAALAVLSVPPCMQTQPAMPGVRLAYVPQLPPLAALPPFPTAVSTPTCSACRPAPPKTRFLSTWTDPAPSWRVPPLRYSWCCSTACCCPPQGRAARLATAAGGAWVRARVRVVVVWWQRWQHALPVLLEPTPPLLFTPLLTPLFSRPFTELSPLPPQVRAAAAHARADGGAAAGAHPGAAARRVRRRGPRHPGGAQSAGHGSRSGAGRGAQDGGRLAGAAGGGGSRGAGRRARGEQGCQQGWSEA